MIIVIYKTNYKSNKYSSIYNNNSNLALDACRHWMVDELKAYWFQDNPLRGHTYFIDVDGQHKRVDDHPELLEAIPKGADHSPVLLYYSYYEQLDPQKLKYAVALGRKLQKPTICLINDYVYNESNKENLNLSDFDVVFYDASYNPKYWKDWLE